MNEKYPMRNNEGYPDPTPYRAVKTIEERQEQRFHRLLSTIFYLCDLAGFRIEGRIVMVDKFSGRVFK